MASGTRGSSIPHFSTTGRATSLQHVLKNVLKCDLTSPLYLSVLQHFGGDDIHAVLSICGIATKVHCTSIIVNKGFTSLVDFGLLSKKDVYEMVKQMGSHTAVVGHVYVGPLQVKKLQALCYWVCDQQKHGQALDHEDWDNEMMASTIERMCIDKE
jgi:hypothetical protein